MARILHRKTPPATESDAKATGGRTHRFADALSEARTRLGEAAAVETDLLQAEEYRLPQKGEEAAREVRTLLAELAAIRNGDKKFTTMAARSRKEAEIQA